MYVVKYTKTLVPFRNKINHSRETNKIIKEENISMMEMKTKSMKQKAIINLFDFDNTSYKARS